MLAHGLGHPRDPVLQPLNNIREQDALLDLTDPSHPREAEWPSADVVVGNPPFLGAKLLRANLGDDYVEKMFGVFGDRLPGMSDLVAYWHEKARAQIAAGRCDGLDSSRRRVFGVVLGVRSWSASNGVATSSSHTPTSPGSRRSERTHQLRGPGRWIGDRANAGWPAVAGINSDLTSGVDLTKARRLKENAAIATSRT